VKQWDEFFFKYNREKLTKHSGKKDARIDAEAG